MASSFLLDANVWPRNYPFLKNYVISGGAVSNNVLYYPQLSIAFYANKYIE